MCKEFDTILLLVTCFLPIQKPLQSWPEVMCALNPVGDSFLINDVCHLALVTSSSSSDICVFYASLVFGIDACLCSNDLLGLWIHSLAYDNAHVAFSCFWHQQETKYASVTM